MLCSVRATLSSHLSDTELVSRYKKLSFSCEYLAIHGTKMTAADPTYPAYPIACSLATAALSLILVTSLARQRWNMGIIFLCVWLGLDNFTNIINSIEWSDNSDLKLYAWCDIGACPATCALECAPVTYLTYFSASFSPQNRFDGWAERCAPAHNTPTVSDCQPSISRATE